VKFLCNNFTLKGLSFGEGELISENRPWKLEIFVGMINTINVMHMRKTYTYNIL
jgi:hypothetical protein